MELDTLAKYQLNTDWVLRVSTAAKIPACHAEHLGQFAMFNFSLWLLASIHLDPMKAIEITQAVLFLPPTLDTCVELLISALTLGSISLDQVVLDSWEVNQQINALLSLKSQSKISIDAGVKFCQPVSVAVRIHCIL